MLNRDEVVRSICAATHDVFSTMMGLEIEAETPYDESTGSDTVDGVVALIGLAGHWVGGGIVQCDAALARELYSRLLMTDAEPNGDGINADVLDAIAEIANMIIGNVKNDVEAQVGTIGMGIPSVVFGRNFSTRNSGHTWTVVPFACQRAHLWVKLCLTPPATNITPAELLSRDTFRVRRVTSV